MCGSINVLINGNNVRHLDGLDTLLSDADEIAVLPPGFRGLIFSLRKEDDRSCDGKRIDRLMEKE